MIVPAIIDEAAPRLVLEPIKRQPCGDTEFVVADPDGHVLVSSELISDSQCEPERSKASPRCSDSERE